MRRRALGIALGLLAAAAIVAAGALLWTGSRSDAVDGGPLAYPDDYQDRLGFTVHLDTPYSWGLVVLRNKGDVPAVVTSITLLERSGSLEAIGLYAVPEDTPDDGRVRAGVRRQPWPAGGRPGRSSRKR